MKKRLQESQDAYTRSTVIPDIQKSMLSRNAHASPEEIEAEIQSGFLDKDAVFAFAAGVDAVSKKYASRQNDVIASNNLKRTQQVHLNNTNFFKSLINY